MANEHRQSLFFRTLAEMIQAGFEPTKALHQLAKGKSPYLDRTVLESMATQVESGDTLAEAMAAHRKTFSPLAQHIVAAGETSGDLPELLRHLSKYFEDRVEARREFWGRLGYPIFLIHAAILIPTIPKLMKSLADYLYVTVPALAVLYGLAGGGYFLYKFIRTRPTLARTMDQTLLGLPFVGNIFTRSALIPVFTGLHHLDRAGVPLAQAIERSAPLSPNLIVEEEVAALVSRIDEGDSMEEVFEKFPRLSSLAHQMLHTGAVSGQLDQSFLQARDHLQEVNRRQIDRTLKVVPFLVYLAVAAYIGYTVVSFYTGMLSRVQ